MHRATRHRGPVTGSGVLAVVLAGAAVLGAAGASAQEASVQGILVDEATSHPLRGADVVLEQSGRPVRSAVTDRNGLFQITGVSPGLYRLRVTSAGYATHEEPIRLRAGEVRTTHLRLAIDPVELEGIGVASRGPGAVERELGTQLITSTELALVPTPAGSGDLVSYLRTQPGVVGSGDRGGQLFIRGGTPSENLVLMDGMLVYQPFHITGLFSTFPAELIQNAELHPGGYGPRYSGRISSVLDVRMRDGSRSEGAVTGSLSPFLAAAVAEGPLGPAGRSSYLVSVRRSLVRETSPWLLGEEQPLGFNSQYLRVSQINDEGSARCAITVLRSRDEGGLDPADPGSRVGWANLLVGGRCTTLAGETFVDVRAGRSGVSSEAVTRGASDYSSSARRIFMDADLSHPLGRVRLNAGAFVHVEGTRYRLQELLAEAERDDRSWGETGMYAELEVPLGRGLRVLPGGVLSIAAGRRPSVEPRLRASWRVEGVVDGELSGAVGLYRQRLAGISDRRDASSVFTAWVRTPEGSRMRAVHAQASWEQTLGGGLSWSVDAYYRRMSDLTVSTWSPIARFTPELALADGRSWGGDVRVELRRGPLYLFGAYAHGWTEYRSAQEDFGVWFGQPVQAFHPPHDRRHQANALGTLALGPFTVAARWEYGSGFPFTRPMGFDELIDLRTDASPLPRIQKGFGQTRILLDRPYTGRLPPTHRLDLSVRRSFDLGARALRLQAGVINAYDQTNIFYYDVFADRRIDQVPFAPYLTVELRPRSRTRP